MVGIALEIPLACLTRSTTFAANRPLAVTRTPPLPEMHPGTPPGDTKSARPDQARAQDRYRAACGRPRRHHPLSMRGTPCSTAAPRHCAALAGQQMLLANALKSPPLYARPAGLARNYRLWRRSRPAHPPRPPPGATCGWRRGRPASVAPVAHGPVALPAHGRPRLTVLICKRSLFEWSKSRDARRRVIAAQGWQASDPARPQDRIAPTPRFATATIPWHHVAGIGSGQMEAAQLNGSHR